MTRLRVEVEGADAVVVRFLLQGDDGAKRPVEMRGERLLGLLDEGDRVVIAADTGGTREDATLRPSTLANLSTGGAVELERPTLVTRVSRAVGLREIRSTAISAGVGGLIAVFVAQLFTSSRGSQGIDVAPEDEVSRAAVALVLAVVFVVVAAIWLLVRRRLPGRLPKWSPLVGLAIGLFAVGIALV